MDSAKQGALETLVGKVEQHVASGEKISIGMIQKVAGQRAAGPMLLFPTLIVVSPLSIIPGLPSLIGINTILVAGQIVLGREQVWLPGWLTKRCLPTKYADRFLGFLKPVTRKVDAVAKPRLSAMLAWPIRRIGAVVCVMVGLIMPLLEFIPFTSTGAGAIIATYGLAITARDGMLALAWIGLVMAVLGIATTVLT